MGAGNNRNFAGDKEHPKDKASQTKRKGQINTGHKMPK
jgi:hypothetical protein